MTLSALGWYTGAINQSTDDVDNILNGKNKTKNYLFKR